MQIKTYKAFSMKDVISKIMTEMGSDAVIISTKQLRNTEYGMMARPMVEVTAAIDYDEDLLTQHLDNKDLAQPYLSGSGQDNSPLIRISSEVFELKGMMKTLIDQSRTKRVFAEGRAKDLESCGIEASLVEMILSRLGDKAGLDKIQGLLKKIVRTSKPTDKKIQIFLGTTGVGKTTTVAKLAARYTLEKNRRAGIITLDTYRIGAVEQLKIYAGILDIPFVSATTEHEFKKALVRLKDCDVILVDTVGRSIFGTDYPGELAPFFHNIPACKFLLIPVATRHNEMKRITTSFSSLGIDRMIFTKSDEAIVQGSIISHNLVFRTPISYLTTGQRVPEDIEKTTSTGIVDLCLGDMQ
ncbi:MAG: flagellar biosynthesis protein FlhF [Thermodesulfobacteriota bacterium]|nr:flagellar biosynthesis protein FlhF [Thermodesulfobacteriota bacterium]